MAAIRSKLMRFRADERGAVTVDWVVLTAALVGLGLAVIGVLSSGVESTSDDIDDTLRGTLIRTSFGDPSQLLSTDFSDGLGDWVGGTVVDLPGFGPVLQLAPGETADILLDVPIGADSATISFDLLGVDDLSGVTASLLVGGEEVALYRDNHGNISAEDLGVSGITVERVQQYENDPVGGGTHGSDSRATYTITVDNPGSDIQFGVRSNTDRPIDEEFFAVDDVAITVN